MSSDEVNNAGLVAMLEQHTKQDADNFEDLVARVDKLDAKVDGLTETLREQKGFVGGVIFVVGALFAVVALVLNHFWK